MKIDWKELLVFQGSFKGVSRKFHGNSKKASISFKIETDIIQSVYLLTNFLEPKHFFRPEFS